MLPAMVPPAAELAALNRKEGPRKGEIVYSADTCTHTDRVAFQSMREIQDGRCALSADEVDRRGCRR